MNANLATREEVNKSVFSDGVTIGIPITPRWASCSGVVDQHIMDSKIFFVLLLGFSLVGSVFVFCLGVLFCFLDLGEFCCCIGFLGVFWRKNLKLGR